MIGHVAFTANWKILRVSLSVSSLAKMNPSVLDWALPNTGLAIEERPEPSYRRTRC